MGVAAGLVLLVGSCASNSSIVRVGTLTEVFAAYQARQTIALAPADPAMAPFPHPIKRREGPGTGPSCRCRRRTCAATVAGAAPKYCSNAEAAVRECFEAAETSGDVDALLSIDASGRVAEATVMTKKAVAACVHQAVLGEHLPDVAAGVIRVVYQVDGAAATARPR